MIEHRPLTKEEINRLIEEAVDSEVKFLKESNLDAYDLFINKSIVNDGLVVDGRPIYIAALIRNKEGRINFWTIVNSNINCVIILSRYVKEELKKWVECFGDLYATMEKVSPKNMKWVEWLGFKVVEEDRNYITYKIGA